MNRAIIDNFNSVVRPEDDVFILGDCLLGGSERLEEGLEMMTWLNGRLHLMRGNHDTNKRWEAYARLPNVVEQETAMFLHYGKYHFYLSHFPSLCSNVDDKGLKHCTINLCGHSHTQNPFADIDKGLIFHCEVDTNNCYPWCIDNIINELKEYVKKQNKVLIPNEEFYTIPTGEKQSITLNSLFNGMRDEYPPRCSKCVYEKICKGTDVDHKCKDYKRDPPDGGYYG